MFDRGIPTPQLLYDFLQMLSVTLISSVPSDDDSDQIYNPWKESSDSKVCLCNKSHNHKHSLLNIKINIPLVASTCKRGHETKKHVLIGCQP